jgi:hypothetical protein
LSSEDYHITPQNKENPIKIILPDFQSISLSDLGEGLLQKRFDTKFVIPQRFLNSILPVLTSEFNILEIDGLREFNHST